MIYFTSDTHFGHRNILKYCSGTRNFKTIEEHDEALVALWNKTVDPGSRVYHLGDFGFGSRDYLVSIINRLNGHKHFIRGNHDKSFPFRMSDYLEIKVPDAEMDIKQNIMLFHYPIAIWNKRHHGSWQLHGHCHGTFPSDDFHARLDVGIDKAVEILGEPRPFSYEEVKEHMTRKVFKPLDHHGA